MSADLSGFHTSEVAILVLAWFNGYQSERFLLTTTAFMSFGTISDRLSYTLVRGKSRWSTCDAAQLAKYMWFAVDCRRWGIMETGIY
jgi:hypothetical protein